MAACRSPTAWWWIIVAQLHQHCQDVVEKERPANSRHVAEPGLGLDGIDIGYPGSKNRTLFTCRKVVIFQDILSFVLDTFPLEKDAAGCAGTHPVSLSIYLLNCCC
ncbi:hypothetical protein DYH55_19820 [Methylovirgula sp. 4M-Z18]|nr:hypothetical protein DYH55_19820 [Methylovirgula sp. 4M-Z18]